MQNIYFLGENRFKKPWPGSGSVFRFFDGSGFCEYGSETLVTEAMKKGLHKKL